MRTPAATGCMRNILELILNTKDWIPAEAGFKEFCRSNPALGLKGTRSSWIWFRRVHGEAMEKAGVMRQSIGRVLIVDKTRFGIVAFDYLTQADKYSAQS